MNREVFTIGLLLLAGVTTGAAPRAAFGASPGGSTWRWEVGAGIDASSHTYALAVDDTTATIAEALVQGAFDWRSGRKTNHRWRCRGDLGVGTELNRQRLDADYRLVDGPWTDRLRADATFTARQYHADSEYTYNSNNNDGLIQLRGSPLLMGNTALELRGHAAWHDYRTPSTLEVDDRQWGGALYLKSPTMADKAWSAGVGALRRVYPDTTEINRDEVGLNLNYDAWNPGSNGFSGHHRSRRRRVADETVRPSAWSHWTDLRLAVPAGSGRVEFDLQGEIWDYDYETEVWFNSWRLSGFGGYRGGDLLSTGWLAGLTAEHLDAGDAPDTYSQMGIRAGVDSYSGPVGGTLTVEVGRRSYRDGSLTYDEGGTETSFEFYTDFTYWKIWLMGSWYISEAFSLEALANFEPENHTEQADDSSIGFLNVRCVWRP